MKVPVPLEDDQTRLEELALETQKSQERAAIRALIHAKKLAIALRRTILQQPSLTDKAVEMKDFAHTTTVSDLESGFKGKAADAAKQYLEDIAQPSLKSPIKVRREPC